MPIERANHQSPSTPHTYTHRCPLAQDEPHFPGCISRQDIDRHRSLSKQVGKNGKEDVQARMGPADVRHIIPAKWFTHGFNRVWARIHANPELLPIIQDALSAADREADSPTKTRQALLGLIREAVNQEVNFFIGPRDINQLNGALIGRTRRLLLAHDEIATLYGEWQKNLPRFHDLANEQRNNTTKAEYLREIETLARRIETILFNPNASPQTAISWERSKHSQNVQREIKHLTHLFEALIDAIHTLGTAAVEPTQGVQKILDLTVAAVDSVCVDPSQVGEAASKIKGDNNQRLFRAMQNDLLLPAGAALVSSSTQFCNAVDTRDTARAEAAGKNFIKSLETLTKATRTLKEYWQWPESGCGRIIAGLESPLPRVSEASINSFRQSLRNCPAPTESRLPSFIGQSESHLKIAPEEAVGVCHREDTPEWISNMWAYLKRIANGESVFDPWFSDSQSED